MCSFNKIHHLSEILESLHFKHTHSLLEYIYVKKNFQKFFYWLRWWRIKKYLKAVGNCRVAEWARPILRAFYSTTTISHSLLLLPQHPNPSDPKARVSSYSFCFNVCEMHMPSKRREIREYNEWKTQRESLGKIARFRQTTRKYFMEVIEKNK